MRPLGAPSTPIGVAPQGSQPPSPHPGARYWAGLSPRTPEGGKATGQPTESQDLQGGSGVNPADHLTHEPQFPRGPDGNAQGGGCVTLMSTLPGAVEASCHPPTHIPPPWRLLQALTTPMAVERGLFRATLTACPRARTCGASVSPNLDVMSMEPGPGV